MAREQYEREEEGPEAEDPTSGRERLEQLSEAIIAYLERDRSEPASTFLARHRGLRELLRPLLESTRRPNSEPRTPSQRRTEPEREAE